MDHIKNRTYSVILSGGSGTRLWPLSRKALPKQYLAFGPSQKSFLQLTLERVQNIARPQNTLLVTTKEQETLCREHLATYGFLGRVVTEPVARNTTAAIALVAHQLFKEDPDSFMVVLPSDHHIQNLALFEQTIAETLTLAQNDFFVVIGIDPTHPATEFGYIELGEKLAIDSTIKQQNDSQPVTETVAYTVSSFREKPDYATAEGFLRTQKYLWNAGIFVWKTNTFWKAFSEIQPTMAAQIESMNDENRDETYQVLDNVPIDIAFLEKARSIACVPARFDWNDVGSWAAIRECFPQDVLGNSIHGNVHAMDVKNCVVHSSGPFVSVIGLENIGVVVTKDAILVTNLAHAQDVKKMAAKFEESVQRPLV